MIKSLVLWLSCLGVWAQASLLSSEGHLLIFDEAAQRQQRQQQSQSEGSVKRTISPEAARLIIASRLGVDRYHDLSSGSTADYDAINAYAGPRHGFGVTNEQRPVALVVLEGLTIKGALPARSRLDISAIPNSKTTDSLLAGLVTQLLDKEGMSGDDALTVNPSRMLHEGAIFRSKSALIRKITASQELDIASLVDSLTEVDYDILLLCTPSSSNSVSPSTYGTWTVPVHDPHVKRADKEEPLEPPRSSSTSSGTDHGPTSSPDEDRSTPLRGILPNCFLSRKACESATRNCTGHGTCSLKFTNKDVSTEGDQKGKQCWGCVCRADVRTNDDGSKKTTNYGGPACQKKDIVAPFWLLAGFSVLFVGLVSWGIGNLYAMGETELPSVIGAGVSGPPKR